MTFSKGDKVTIKLIDRDADWSERYGETSTRGEVLAAWEGTPFIVAQDGVVDFMGPHYMLFPIEGHRPDEFDGDPGAFYWQAEEVVAYEE